MLSLGPYPPSSASRTSVLASMCTSQTGSFPPGAGGPPGPESPIPHLENDWIPALSLLLSPYVTTGS